MEEDATRASDERLGGGALERCSSTYDFDLMISEENRSKNLLPLSRIFIIPFFRSSFPIFPVFSIQYSHFLKSWTQFSRILGIILSTRNDDFHELYRNELLNIISLTIVSMDRRF